MVFEKAITTNMLYKINVYVPLAHADAMRKVIGEAGGGRVGNYSFASFSSRGTGRFKPEEGAKPAIGEIGKLEEVEEEKLEFVCDKEHLSAVLAAIRRTHPYEEPGIDVWKLIEI